MLTESVVQGTLPNTAYDIGVAEVKPDGRRTSLDWPVEPDGLRDLLVGLRDRFENLPPVYITENGGVFDDDRERITFIEDHVDAVRAAIAAGVDVRGYFYWSLIDNFEWARGYGPRFGLVHVDYVTQRRTPRPSYHWYAGMIRRT